MRNSQGEQIELPGWAERDDSEQIGTLRNHVDLTMPRPSGALELTWTNKHLTLLSHEEGTYEWVDPSDHRVSEVRLLKDAGTIGDTHLDSRRAEDNLLIRGDALHALTSLAKLPEFADEYRGRVKLVYIDPPFNTGQAFAQYDDNLEHSVWLTMMRDRLLQIRELLAPDGSVWVHLDDYEAHRAKVVLDEILGMDAFVATIVWQKKYSRDTRPAIGQVHDFIHVYAPLGRDWSKVRNQLPRDQKTASQYTNPNNDPKGPWRAIPMTAQGFRKNQMYPITTPAGVTHLPPKGRCWSMVEERYEELLDAGRIYFGKDGTAQPGVIRYLSEAGGLTPWTWWPHDEVGHTDESKKEILDLFPEDDPFDTPKPERLMERVIHIASDPGDIVLDSFVGSGTTAAVAQKMARRWVGIEWSESTLTTFAIPRLTKVVDGNDPGGITESVGWEGGGGFRVLDVAPSMFEEDEGVIYLADWAESERLAEPVAAQLGYEYESDPPFAGRKGRSRLAVIDGVVSTGVVDILIDNLGENESVVICGTAVAPDARAHIKNLSKASRIRKIPASILAEYRLTYRRRRVVELNLQEDSEDSDMVQKTEPADV